MSQLYVTGEKRQATFIFGVNFIIGLVIAYSVGNMKIRKGVLFENFGSTQKIFLPAHHSPDIRKIRFFALLVKFVEIFIDQFPINFLPPLPLNISKFNLNIGNGPLIRIVIV